MITRKDVMPVNFLKKEKFTGSDTGMRYRMEMVKREIQKGNDAEEKSEEETILLVTSWPEPYGYDATPDEQKIREEFPFSEDGIVSGVEWLNQQHSRYAALDR